MIRVTGSSSLLMSSLNTDTENHTKIADLLEKQSSSTGKTETGKVHGVKDEKYDAVKKSASELKTLASKLSDTDTDSIFAKAQESGEKQEVIDNVQAFTDKYNSLMKALSDLQTEKAEASRSELHNIVSEKAEELKKAGITVQSDGTLTVDEETLNAAELSDLKALFQGEKSVAGKIAEKSVYIGANAAADKYMDACSNYTSGGTAADYDQMVNMIGGYLDSLS